MKSIKTWRWWTPAWLLLGVLEIGCASPTPPSPAHPAVEVVCSGTGRVRGTGTLIDDGTRIVTALHVARECKGRMEIQNEHIGSISVRLRRVDVNADIALLESSLRLLGGVTLGESDALRIGDAVRVVGFPWCSVCGSGRTLRLERSAQVASVETHNVILMGSFGVGDSGAPVLRDGRLVGMVVAKPMVELPDWWLGQRIRVPTQDGIGVAVNVEALRALIEYGTRRKE